MVWKLGHVLNAGQFDRQILEEVYSEAEKMESLIKGRGYEDLMHGKILTTLFYEPSTRTRLSFESAMLRLGGNVISTENAKLFSSAAKGETLEDTIRVINGYSDVIVMRHYEEGAAMRASLVSRIPVINAGDGSGEHPTQSLLDLYTINKEFEAIDGKSIAMVGDLLNGRTVRSLSQLLTNYHGIKAYFVSPDEIRMREDVKNFLREKGVSYEEHNSLDEVLPLVDVVYMTRIQKERFSSEEEYLRFKGCYVLNKQNILLMKPGAIVLHPLPRVGEISVDVDKDPRARYFEQAENSLYVRMALLHLLMK